MKLWIEVLPSAWDEWKNRPYFWSWRFGRILKRKPNAKQRPTEGYWIQIDHEPDADKLGWLERKI